MSGPSLSGAWLGTAPPSISKVCCTIIERDYLTDSDLTEELIKELNEKLWYTGSDHFILFDKNALLDNLKNIRYLYGQLIAVHRDTNSIHTDEDSDSSVMKNYQSKI